MINPPLVINQWINGLGALGKLESGKFQTLDNVEIHDETGIVKPQHALAVESATPNEPCFSAIDPSGNKYFASKTSGKIWKRTTAGSYSLAHTNANANHRGIRYFNGYLWYWTATKLGTYDLASTWSDSFATGTDFRQGIEANNQLFISNGRYTARVDATNTFSANEFVAPAQFKQTAIQNIGDDILIGTYVSNDVSYCKVFLWNTVSPSWTSEDEVFEIGVNCFVQLDNDYLVQCGTSGAFYYWTGSRMAFYGEIRGITTTSGEQMSVTYNRRPLFANANKIYSIFKRANGLPVAFSCEYTATDTIASLGVQGQTLLVSTASSVNKNITDYATSTIITWEIQSQITRVVVQYDAYPEGVSLFVSVNGGAYDEKTLVFDETFKELYFDGGVKDGATGTIKVVLTPSGTNRPAIKSITVS
jgi:hypothetical protein